MTHVLDTVSKANPGRGVHFYLRTPGGSVYGPAPMSVLVSWAESGRIAAGDEISQNRAQWVTAVDVPDLKMDWFGNRPTGEAIGPFNLHAVPHLLRRGILDVGCTLRHRTTGEQKPAVDHAGSAFARGAGVPASPPQGLSPGTETAVQPEPLQGSASSEKLRIRVVESAPRAGSSPGRTDQQESELEDALATALRRAEEETRILGEQYATFQKTAAAKESDLAAQLEKMRDDAHTANILLEAARVEIERLKERGVSLEKDDAASRKAARSAEALREECDHLRLQLRQRQEEMEKERAAATRRESQQKLAVQTLEDRLREVEEQYRALRQEEASLRRQMESSDAERDALRRQANDRQDVLRETQEQARQEREAAAERERKFVEDGLAATRRAETQALLLKEAQATVAHLREARQRDEAEIATLRRLMVDAESAAPVTQWFLRGEGTPTIGPVTLSDIFEWATDCRVGPDHEVSLGGTEWRRACDVPELEMEWNVPLRDGTPFGPINVFAARSLLADGVVAGDAQIENRRTGETLRADTLNGPATESALRIALLVHRKLARTEQKVRRQTEALLVARQLEPPSQPPQPEKAPEPPKAGLSLFARPASSPPPSKPEQPAGGGRHKKDRSHKRRQAR
jgi:hypothetical protein